MVQGVGCMVKGVGFGFRLEGVPLEALAAPQELVQGRLQQQDPPMFVIRISGFGFQVRVSRFRFRTRSFGFRISCFRFRVSGFESRVSGFNFGYQASGCTAGGIRRATRAR